MYTNLMYNIYNIKSETLQPNLPNFVQLQLHVNVEPEYEYLCDANLLLCFFLMKISSTILGIKMRQVMCNMSHKEDGVDWWRVWFVV